MDQIHVRNWLECIHKGQRDTHCTAEQSYQHAIACIMADRALHSGRRQVWEEKSRTIREAWQLLAKTVVGQLYSNRAAWFCVSRRLQCP